MQPQSDASESEVQETFHPLDIGFFVNRQDPLSDEERHRLYTNVWRPSSRFVFPRHQEGNKARAFQHDWFRKYSWLVYSEMMDGGFCLPCVLFAKHSSDFGQLVTSPLTSFTSASNRLKEHEKKKYHNSALADADTFLRVYCQQQASVQQQMLSSHQKQIQANRKIIESLVKIIIFCGKQNIALRGHRCEDVSMEDNSGNPGNFLALVKFRMESGDVVLQDHISSAAANAMYVSPQIQNELISCVGDWILESVLTDVQQAGHFAVLADEAVDISISEQMPLVLRFVDGSSQIREEFVGFVLCDSGTSGRALSEKILSTLQQFNLDLRMLRGQGYDGAANMAGRYSGTAALIQQQYPLAVYTHCAAHVLNLCIVKAMSIVPIRNMMGTLKDIYLFFHGSAKRQQQLEQRISGQRHKLKNLCKTRWVERHEALHTFADMYGAIVETLDHISHGGSDEEVWDADSTSKAGGLLSVCLSFVFRMAFVLCKSCLSYVLDISRSLQKKAKDICDAYSEVNTVIDALKEVRDNVDDRSERWFREAQRMGEQHDGPLPSVPRRCSRQTQRDNIPGDTPEEYFRRTLTIPFIDELLQHMETRFSPLQSKAMQGLRLVPTMLTSVTNAGELDEMVAMYEEDLPSPATWEAELHRWRVSWQGTDLENMPGTPAEALVSCNKDLYPNIYTLLKIICTLPLTTSTCERSISVIRRLKTYLRATMDQRRMSSLALMHIHYNMQLNLDEIVDMFCRKNPRRMALNSII